MFAEGIAGDVRLDRDGVRRWMLGVLVGLEGMWPEAVNLRANLDGASLSTNFCSSKPMQQ